MVNKKTCKLCKLFRAVITGNLKGVVTKHSAPVQDLFRDGEALCRKTKPSEQKEKATRCGSPFLEVRMFGGCLIVAIVEGIIPDFARTAAIPLIPVSLVDFIVAHAGSIFHDIE